MDDRRRTLDQGEALVKNFNISCEHVIQEVSNYIDGDVLAELRAGMETHLAGCVHCRSVLDGVRNTISLVAEGRVLESPQGFGSRLYRKIQQSGYNLL